MDIVYIYPKKFVSRKYIIPLLLFIQIIILKIVSFFPELIEQYYSNGLYPYISKFSRTIFGQIPFSFGDVLYGILIFWSIYWFYKNKKVNWKIKALSGIKFVTVVYFLFHFLWALNYYRLPLAKKMSIKTDYTDTQLLAFTKKIITKTNTLQFQITQDTAKKVVNPFTQDEIFEKAVSGYKNLAKTYSFFNYSNPSVKKSLFSYPLTYMGFGGYLNPFTNEAQANKMIPRYNFPSTTCHEMAHQMGFASESECNFIGFLAATKNDDLYFKYSGYSNALHYCLFNWEVRDPKILAQLLKTVHPGVLKNYKESKIFWESHQTFIDTGFKIFYDNFLKWNQQKDGLESYSKFVDLLVNYYQYKAL
jgi:hypothetical protein